MLRASQILACAGILFILACGDDSKPTNQNDPPEITYYRVNIYSGMELSTYVHIADNIELSHRDFTTSIDSLEPGIYWFSIMGLKNDYTHWWDIGTIDIHQDMNLTIAAPDTYYWSGGGY